MTGATMTPDRILAYGAEVGWPSVRIERAEVLQAGEASWRKHVALLTPRQHARLVEAIQNGWAEGPGGRGLVRDG